jgi:hypothetical protein
VAAGDADALKGLLAANVRFRALTPGGIRETDDAGQAVDEILLGAWFPPGRSITDVVDISCGSVGPLDRVTYRFRANFGAQDLIVEQQAYLAVEDAKIASLRILCSGFVDEH